MGRQAALLTHDRPFEGLFLYHRLLAAHKRGLELLKAHLIRRLLHICGSFIPSGICGLPALGIDADGDVTESTDAETEALPSARAETASDGRSAFPCERAVVTLPDAEAMSLPPALVSSMLPTP